MDTTSPLPSPVAPTQFSKPVDAPLSASPGLPLPPSRFSRAWFWGGITLIAIGAVWLLASQGYLPDINWFIVLTLFFLGVIPLGIGGLNKFTFINAGFFLSSSVASVLVQTNRVALNVAVPSVVIATGLATLVAMLLSLPLPAWLIASQRLGLGLDQVGRRPALRPTQHIEPSSSRPPGG